MSIRAKFITLFFVTVLFVSGFLFQSTSQAETDGGMMPGQVLVKFKSGANVRNIHVANGTRTLEIIPKVNVHVVGLGRGVDPVAAVERFKKNPNVEFAEVDGLWEAVHDTGETFIPNDIYFNAYQWNMNITESTDAWYVTKGSNVVKIAILDTGIKSNHEDISPKVVLKKNFTNSKTVEDKNGHGTHVAAIASARTGNGKGVAGVGYNCVLMNGKVLNDSGSGSWSGIANGIIWAADNGAKVINMSLGGSSGSSTVQSAINYAWNKGVVIVAAAGNEGISSPSYPAYYSNVIAVAATDENDNIASFSNYGTWVDVAAPGVDILSAYIRYNPPYVFLSGTSMASPHVAGLAGLLASQGRSNVNIRAAIENTTDNIGLYSIANGQKGRINAHKAVDYPY